MRVVDPEKITQAVAAMCVRACRVLPADVRAALDRALAEETHPAGREVLRQLVENYRLAEREGLPLCQDTGLAVFFVEKGDAVRVPGGVAAAIEAGVRQGYAEGLLRKSSCHPLSRQNTGDNTPAVVHLEEVPGDGLRIAFMAKGGGSENMSRVTMLSPAQGWEGIRRFVVERVAEAGPNPCPPIVVGVGIGGSFELAARLSKQALLRPLDDTHPDAEIAALEAELVQDINALGIGPMGLGGRTTALGVKIALRPCHIASLPVAVNIQCHSARHEEVVF
jgi:fumarate hydratase subunit alpha